MKKQTLDMADEAALQNFLLDIECLDRILPWTGSFNLFDVLKISRAELRHSNMLSWLLNPNENHGLGDLFLKGILQELLGNACVGRYDVLKILLLDFYSFAVYREWKNIDILLVSNQERVIIAIENKVGTHEHSNQLDRYRKTLEMDYADYLRIFVYLTPDGEKPSDTEKWDVLTYDNVVEVLEGVTKKTEIPPDVSLMLNNYIAVVRRDIVEDKELAEICNEIYTKHKKALDLIYKYRIDGQTQIAEMMKNSLREMDDEGKIFVDEAWGLGFHTSTMNGILKPLTDEKSSWGTVNLYEYWFMLNQDRFYLLFELGGYNVPQKEMANMQAMIDALKPSDKKRNDFRYKRIHRSKWYDVSDADDVEAAVRTAVREAVNDMLKKEKELKNMVMEKKETFPE